MPDPAGPTSPADGVPVADAAPAVGGSPIVGGAPVAGGPARATPAPMLTYASVPPLTGLAPLAAWSRRPDGTVELLVYPGPVWRPIVHALLALGAQAFAVPFAVVMVEVVLPFERVSLWRVGGLCAAGWVGCAGRTARRVRRLWRDRGGSHVGTASAGRDGLTVTAPPSAGGRSTTWPRADVVGLRCELVGVARGLQEYLLFRVELRGGRTATARLPWPPATGMADVELRLRAGLGLPAFFEPTAGGGNG